jgi:hypothetical protein
MRYPSETEEKQSFSDVHRPLRCYVVRLILLENLGVYDVPPTSPPHLPQVRFNLEGLIEPICEVSHTNDEGQFYDLVFTVIFPQLLQCLLADG